MRRRLLERLQQGIEGFRGQHVRLVDDVHLDLQRRRQILHPLAQIPDLIDTAVRRRIDLDQVDGRARCNFDAVRANAARLGALAVQTIDRFRQDPGGRCLPRSANAREEIRVRDAPLLDGIPQSLGNSILPDQVAQRLGPVLEVKGLVRHQLPRQFYEPAGRTLARRSDHALGLLAQHLARKRDCEHPFEDGGRHAPNASTTWVLTRTRTFRVRSISLARPGETLASIEPARTTIVTWDACFARSSAACPAAAVAPTMNTSWPANAAGSNTEST